MFLRNHDELTLEMVTDAERDYLWSTYAADPRARINLGIRRRLAPLMDNDRRKIELMNSILMSMPGTPIIYYGDEIGMGDNIYLGDRNSVRTPMQWTPDRNGGFSRADPAQLYLPRDHGSGLRLSTPSTWRRRARSLSSLLNWMKRLIGVRKSTKVFGRGTLALHPAGQPHGAGLRAPDRRRSDPLRRQHVALGAGGRARHAAHGRAACRRKCSAARVSRASATCPTSSRCRRTASSGSSSNIDPKSEPEKVLPREITTLVVGRRLGNALSSWTRRTFEPDVLPGFMPERRWFADKDARVDLAEGLGRRAGGIRQRRQPGRLRDGRCRNGGRA